MTSGRLRFADRRCGVALTVLVSLLAVSCTSTGEPNFEMANPGFAADATSQATVPENATATGEVPTAANLAMSAEGDTALPDQVGYVPLAKPGATPAETALASEEQPQQAIAAAEQPKAEPAPPQTAEAKPKPVVQQDTGFYLTAGPETPPEPAKKKGLLASLFGATPAKAAPAPTEHKAKPLIETAAPAQAPTVPEGKAKPLITLASAKSDAKPVALASLGGSSSSGDSDFALPGVRQTDLFEIKRKSGIDDDSDVDLHEDEDPGLYQMASAAGMARLAPNGLLKQTESVDVACLKPSLVRVLKAVEQHYGKKMLITSGYRNPERNRRARGAKNSQHMYCAAADIQVPGVGKWELATFLRAMPGRGGVGTYCHTNSVHVDIGPERDWNWRCRRGS